MIELTSLGGARLRATARSLFLASCAAIGASLLLSACGGGPPKARLEEQQQQREFESRGYAGEPAPRGAEVQPVVWRLRGEDLRLSLALPAPNGSKAEKRPVIVYLPGLGESETAGLRWRRAWAAAGYAVLSLQPLEDDAMAWSSELARSAEFTELGRRHYADVQTRRRLARLDELLTEAQRLSREGAAPWRWLDWSRTAVAGYELGAQMAMVLAGERQADGTVLASSVLRPAAAIVISPQVLAQPDPARYRDVAIPVLGLTGPEDSDVLGLVRDLRWRELPFAAMPAGRGWLLSVAEVRHAAFGGNEPRPEDVERENKRIRKAEEDAQSQPPQGRHGAGRGAPARMAPVPAVPDYRRLHEQQLGVIAARQVSVAFLDAQIKESAAARAWLAGPAQAWMGKVGVLTGGR